MSKLIYHNFDKLEVTFQGAFPERIIKQLKELKEEAQANKKFIHSKLGNSNSTYKISPNGLGGFSLGFITANEGLQISTQKSTNKDLWNIFIGARSFYLATNGYEAVKNEMLDVLNDLCAETNSRICPYTGEVTTRPLESIRRIDYCFDFNMPDFIPKLEHIVYHASGKMRRTGELLFQADRQGVKDNALTIGSKGRRAVQIYDKTHEIKTKQNTHWYKIWAKEEDLQQVWRIEWRFCKDFIRDKELRTFEGLERNLDKALENSFEAVRYTVPSTDTNRSRWRNVVFWDIAKAASHQVFEHTQSNVTPETVLRLNRLNSLKAIEGMIEGILISYAVLNQVDYSSFLEIIRKIEDNLKYSIKESPEIIQKKYRDAEKRYYIEELPM